MPSSGRSKRARSRKRRSRSAGAPGAGAASATALAEPPARSQPRSAARRGEREASRPPRQSPTARAYGERPKPPWHPLPISELLILAGMVGVVVGIRSTTASHAAPPLLAGLLAVSLGTFEVTLREHRSGHRSHKIMLAALPVLIFHTGVVLGVSIFTSFPPIANLGLIAVDVAIFALMFRLLRSSFLDARAKLVSGRR